MEKASSLTKQFISAWIWNMEACWRNNPIKLGELNQREVERDKTWQLHNIREWKIRRRGWKLLVITQRSLAQHLCSAHNSTHLLWLQFNNYHKREKNLNNLKKCRRRKLVLLNSNEAKNCPQPQVSWTSSLFVIYWLQDNNDADNVWPHRWSYTRWLLKMIVIIQLDGRKCFFSR